MQTDTSHHHLRRAACCRVEISNSRSNCRYCGRALPAATRPVDSLTTVPARNLPQPERRQARRRDHSDFDRCLHDTVQARFAVEDGFTHLDVQEATGITVTAVAHGLRRLCKAGRLRIIGQQPIGRGRHIRIYQLVRQQQLTARVA